MAMVRRATSDSASISPSGAMAAAMGGHSVDVQPLDEVTIVDAAVVDLVADVVDGRVDDRSPRAIHESGIRHRVVALAATQARVET